MQVSRRLIFSSLPHHPLSAIETFIFHLVVRRRLHSRKVWPHHLTMLSPACLVVRPRAYQSLRYLSVRVILKEDLHDAYEGDVKTVKPGYARNYLIPKKIAVYATPENFQRLGIVDPDAETLEEKRERLAREAAAEQQEGAEDVKAADLLRYYLRNKVLKIWRNVDGTTGMLHPGLVDAKAVRQKLRKQLRIDLEPGELVHLRAEPLTNITELTDEDLDSMVKEIGTDQKCSVEIRTLGEYLARITLAGGVVPLRFVVLRR